MEYGTPSLLDETIAELASGDQPLSGSRLINLSNMNSAETKLFEQAWAGVKPELRRETIRRLAELAEDKVELNFDSIFRHCLRDRDAEVRRQAIEGLWENEDASLIKPLVELLEKDPSPEVQAAAATALGRFVLLAELGKLRPKYIPKLERSLLETVDAETRLIKVRGHALEAVAPLSRPEVSKAIQTAYKSRDAEFRISAVTAMGKNCDPSWLPALLHELTRPDAEMRFEAAEACGELGAEAAVPPLIELVNDPDTRVALVAIEALGKIGGIEAKRCLEQYLDDPEDLVKQAATQALEELAAEEDPLLFGF